MKKNTLKDLILINIFSNLATIILNNYIFKISKLMILMLFIIGAVVSVYLYTETKIYLFHRLLIPFSIYISILSIYGFATDKTGISVPLISIGMILFYIRQNYKKSKKDI